MSLTMKMDLSISPCSYISFCFIHFQVILLITYTLQITSSCLIEPMSDCLFPPIILFFIKYISLLVLKLDIFLLLSIRAMYLICSFVFILSLSLCLKCVLYRVGNVLLPTVTTSFFIERVKLSYINF